MRGSVDVLPNGGVPQRFWDGVILVQHYGMTGFSFQSSSELEATML